MLLSGIVLFIFIACAILESYMTGLFQTFHVYNRKQVSWALFLPVGCSICFTGAVYQHGETSPLILGGICIAIGLSIYYKIFKKCPTMLKKLCIPAIFVSSCGIAIKSLSFFIKSIWTIETPEKVKSKQNKILYNYNGKIYDEYGNPVNYTVQSRKEKRLQKNSHKKK